jgi:hypothetical protein
VLRSAPVRNRSTLGFFALLVAGCGEVPPPPPTAVIEALPRAICEGDDHRTPIRLDASKSVPRLALIPVVAGEDDPPLDISWAFSGAAHRVLDGDLAALQITVSTAGDRPLHVSLTVENAGGGRAESLTTIHLTAAPCEPEA